MDKALFYSMLLENYGPGPILDAFLPRMKKLVESQQVRKYESFEYQKARTKTFCTLVDRNKSELKCMNDKVSFSFPASILNQTGSQYH